MAVYTDTEDHEPIVCCPPHGQYFSLYGAVLERGSADGGGGGGTAMKNDDDEVTAWEVLVAEGSTIDESFAAQELSNFVSKALGRHVPTVGRASTSVDLTLAVGYAAAMSVGLTADILSGLGNESFVVTSNTSSAWLHQSRTIVISGGYHSKRGAIYGVYHLLERHLGFKFYAPNDTVVPAAAAMVSAMNKPIDVRRGPAMELRSLESYETNGGGDPSRLWELRNRGNGCEGPMHGVRLAGGCMTYASPPGLVHTSYRLLAGGTAQGFAPADWPPLLQLYNKNPSWFCELIRSVACTLLVPCISAYISMASTISAAHSRRHLPVRATEQCHREWTALLVEPVSDQFLGAAIARAVAAAARCQHH